MNNGDGNVKNKVLGTSTQVGDSPTFLGDKREEKGLWGVLMWG